MDFITKWTSAKMTRRTLIRATALSMLFSGIIGRSAMARSNQETLSYRMPGEDEPHEGTWLQWPHDREYDDGITFRDRLDPIWVAMTKALVGGEKVHIIAWDKLEENRITHLLESSGVPMENVNFFLFPTNDVWARDNGPIFVRDRNGKLLIEDWGFNGWGGRDNWELDNAVPASIGTALKMDVIDLKNTMINEGGAVEMDGAGVLMACRSSILSQRPKHTVRNPDMTQAQAEATFSAYLGIKKFIWLDGWVNDPDDPTDAHIDGFARFAGSRTIITMQEGDLRESGLSRNDIATLLGATNAEGQAYDFIHLPLTQRNVTTAYGKKLGYKGSYVNYYISNKAVLVPNYNDPNDALANSIIGKLYKDRTIIGIDVRNLYEHGGMIHCVTQQQPA